MAGPPSGGFGGSPDDASDCTRLPFHSAAYFGASRDYWWNQDFVDLLARRLDLAQAVDVLDAGTGAGHWLLTIAAHLAARARVVAIDRDPGWPPVARVRLGARLGSGRVAVAAGDAERLPFRDRTFDLVTCQTVLIHTGRPEAALAEFVRVVRRGGRLLLVEPNNRAANLVLDSVTGPSSVEEVVAHTAFELRCERGRTALGEGDISVGDRLPQLAIEAGLVDVRVFLGDRAEPLAPPYRGEGQQAAIEDFRRDAADERWIWDRPTTERYFVAGGGDPARFEAGWSRVAARRAAVAAAVDAGAYWSPGGSITYVVSGVRP